MEQHYWVPSTELVFIPCRLERKTDKDAVFVTESSAEITHPAKSLGDLLRVHESQRLGVDNVCSLEEVCHPALLHTVRVRYGRQQIYTHVARILIAVNPFKSLPIYSMQYLEKYRSAITAEGLPPHIYSIGSDAVINMRNREDASQAVLISGESGAGKTESTKQVLMFAAEVLGAKSGGLQDNIMRTNPVLEAFGNAMTVRNNNSSRFGKWLQLTVPESLTIEGCTVTDYLLELTRVCSPGASERNYHIFFQLIEARDRDELKHLSIAAPGEYVYLQGCKHKAPGIDDMNCFDELKEAFGALGFSSTLQDEVFRLVVGILALGNVDFIEVDDKAAVRDDSVLNRLAGLIGIEADVLRRPLLERKIMVGKDVTIVERTAPQAKSVRDGLARLLYGRLFKWLIAKINEQLSGKTSTGRFFGLLDIAGFESFEKNSLEQLFINLSNEQLQQHFNTYVFKLELDDYEAEGINTGNQIGFVDNTDIIALLEAKNGILPLLDEEASLAKATDETFVNKVIKAHDKHRRLVVPKFTGGLKFGIKHFAGEVTYTCDGFLEKNVDKPPDDAPTLLQASSLQVLQELGAKIAAEVAEAGGGGGRQKKAKSVSSSFRTSLASLMAKLKEAEPHFIRCVKPNVEKVPDKFTSKLVNEQLLNSGVFEAVKIRQSGFASRIPFQEFWNRFWVCIPKKKRVRESLLGMAVEDQVKLLVEMMPIVLLSVGGVHKGELVLGRTKVFAKTRVVNALEQCRELSVTGHAHDIMRIWRGNRVRKMMRSCVTIYAELKHWISENDFYTSSGGQETAMSKYQTAEGIKAEVEKLNGILERMSRLAQLPRGEAMRTAAEKVRQRMLNEVEAIGGLHSLKDSLDPIEIEKGIARIKALDIPTVNEVEVLMARVQKLTVQAPLIQALENAIDSEDLQQFSEVWEIVRKEGFKDHPEYWLFPRGSELVSQMWNSMETLKAKKKQEEAEEKKKRDAEKAEAEKAKMEVTFEEKQQARPSQSPTPMGRARTNKKRSTITGFSEQQQQRVLLSLMEACRVYDLAAIEKNLQEATRQGIPSCEATEKAHELLQSMQTEDFLMEAIQRKQTSLHGEDVPVDELRSLRNLLHHASTLNFAMDELKDARGHLQQGVRRRARTTIHGKVFEEVDLEEIQLVEGTFCLSHFKSLKPVDQWRRGRSLLEKITKRKEQETDEQTLEAMVSYQRDPINTSLTCVSPTRDLLCVRTFQSILRWMGDKPVPEVQLFGYVQEICETANADRFMADETYVQLMKQLTKNPSKRSTLQGYKLMLRLCQTVSPSKDLDEFVRSFLMTSLHSERDEIVMICKQCIADLNLALSKDHGEDDSAGLIPLSVLLIDNSTRKLHVSAKARLKEIGERLCEQLRIPEPRDFAFFQLTDGIDMHRLLPDVVQIDVLLEKWVRLKEATKRQNRLLFKRRLLRHDERLQASNFAHATLTYQQAYWDFLHYPIHEDTDFVCEIAAAVLLVERESFSEQIEKRRLGDAGVLERLLPDSALKMHKWGRSKLATQVLQAYQKLETNWDPRETGYVKMSHCLSLMQRLRLFGTYHWLGKQTLTPEPEKASVPAPPANVCRINPKEPECDYWICVDTIGIRFVSPDCTSGKKSSYQRSFLFNEEALEKVICCGAKQNLVQFVVTTVDTSQSSQGASKTMLISLSCPAAVDVAYLVHTLHEIRAT